MIDTIKLEHLLVSKWAEFIDPRKMLDTVSSLVSEAYHKQIIVERITLSRFELTKLGFIVWADFATTHFTGTTEFILGFNGSINHIETKSG